DLVICHDYGTCMYNCKPEDGKISWLRNPGASGYEGAWERFPVADLMATHRLQLMALPVVGPNGVHEPVQVTLYAVPDEPLKGEPWEPSLIDADSFRV